MATPRQALVVLGMHRGGTSALAGAAVRLGFAGPKTPLEASSDNPAGFYESLPLAKFNYNILRGAGCAWNVCLTFDGVRAKSSLRAEDWAMLAQGLREEFGEAQNFVFKDPRLCIIWPIWYKALLEAGMRPVILLILRHPAEVVQSLARRNQFSVADTAPHWLHHMLEAEFWSRPMRRAVLSYDELLADWRGVLGRAGAQAGLVWPLDFDTAAPALEAFLAPAARHFDAGAQTARLGPKPVDAMLEEAYACLQKLGTDPKNFLAETRLDEIRGDFAAWRKKNFPPGFHATFDDGS